MCIYNVTHPTRSKPIGKMHTTLGRARKAAHRAAKRYGFAEVHHWRNGLAATVFPDGATIFSDGTTGSIRHP